MNSLKFSVYSIVTFATSFTSSFPIWIIFVVWFVVAGTSNTTLNKSVENGYPCLVPDLRGKVFKFHHWVWFKLCTCHIWWPLLCWVMLLLYPFFKSFNINGHWILLKAFSAFIEMITWFLFFNVCHGLHRPGPGDWSWWEEGRRGPESRVQQGYFICRNACLYIFNKIITQPLKRMKFHQLQQNG